LATACWDFIVVKRTGWKAASLLDFCPLQRSDREMFSTSYPQTWTRSGLAPRVANLPQASAVRSS
jgi:hypothetical protein